MKPRCYRSMLDVWLQLEVTTAFGECLRFDLQDTTHGALVSALYCPNLVAPLASWCHMHMLLTQVSDLQALSAA